MNGRSPSLCAGITVSELISQLSRYKGDTKLVVYVRDTDKWHDIKGIDDMSRPVLQIMYNNEIYR